MLLKCKNRGSSISDANVSGDGRLPKQKDVGTLTMSKTWMMHDVLHAVEDIL